MQRILQPGEIESLDRIEFPRVRLPQPATLFTERAARLRQKADGHPIADYLRFLAVLVDLQAQAAATVATQPVPEAVIAQSLDHGMPVLPAPLRPDPAWLGEQIRQLRKLRKTMTSMFSIGATLTVQAVRVRMLKFAKNFPTHIP